MSSKRLILFYFIGIAFPSYLQCQTVCRKLDKIIFYPYREIVYVNETYREYGRYYYSQIINLKQPSPMVNGKFHEMQQNDAVIRPPFSVEFYGEHYDVINVNKRESCRLFVTNSNELSETIRRINTFIYKSSHQYDVYIATEDKFVAVKWLSKDKSIQVHSYLYANGNITFYYEKIPNNINRKEIESGISNDLVCKNTETEICSKQQSAEQCFNSTISKVRCYWCPTIKKCSNGQDIQIIKWLENDCDKMNISQPQDLTTATSEVTTSENTEEQKNISRSQRSTTTIIIVVSITLILLFLFSSLLIFRKFFFKKCATLFS
ncbi:unnamed protein product [Schistosoma turkestanicum]|nr:unnamed protein product [Schistosoma turkestanicum]